jgi:hypothetical protein
MSQLAEQHGHKLRPTGESSRVPFCFVFRYRCFKFDAGDELQELGENAAYSMQGGMLLGWIWISWPNSIGTHPARRPLPLPAARVVSTRTLA